MQNSSKLYCFYAIRNKIEKLRWGQLKNWSIFSHVEKNFQNQKPVFGNYFRHAKKSLNFLLLAEIKVAPAKFFNFGFHCKPSFFLFVIGKIRKTMLNMGTNR